MALGGEVGFDPSPSASVIRLDPNTKKFVNVVNMNVARKDHACLRVTIGSSEGILVTSHSHSSSNRITRPEHELSR